jgi:hypothetical protein
MKTSRRRLFILSCEDWAAEGFDIRDNLRGGMCCGGCHWEAEHNVLPLNRIYPPIKGDCAGGGQSCLVGEICGDKCGLQHHLEERYGTPTPPRDAWARVAWAARKRPVPA